MPDVHAAMLGDIGGLPWLGMLLEVVGRSHHHQPPIRPDPDRDHVLAERLAQPDAGVEALFHHVGEAVIDVELQCDVRILGEEPGKARADDGLHRIVRAGEPQGSGRAIAQIPQCLHTGADGLEVRCDGAHQALARLGRGNVARGPGQQPDAQALLQQPHGVAERRGRHPQANSCLGEALLLCHHQEGLQVVGLHAAHGSIVSSTQ
ncbi:hypothetical protein D3C75_491090 [compost metagenome]